MFLCFLFFICFLYFFNFVFLLSLKQKRTKLQISPFPGQSECFVAVLLTSSQKSCRILDVFRPPTFYGPAFQKLYAFYHPCSFNVLYACFKNVFYKSEKNMFLMFFLFENQCFFNIYACSL